MSDRQESIADIVAADLIEAARRRIATPAEGMPPKRDAHRGAHPETAESCLGTGEMDYCQTVQIGEVSGGGRAEAKPRTATAGADPEPAKSFVNAAAMREAMEMMSDLFEEGVICISYENSPKEVGQIEELYHKVKAALAKPPRNFDRFANLHDAWVAWQSDCAYNIGTETMRFLVWLYSTAEKGETDGSK